MYAGRPSEQEYYEEVEANGLKVYLPKSAVISPDGVAISMGGLGPWRRLRIQGIYA
ncbi:MAG: hypothetical protein K6U04_03085 [Armatimonadetes bacterium]|nr:hypothetical protein [Armatimonadota bacterium]